MIGVINLFNMKAVGSKYTHSLKLRLLDVALPSKLGLKKFATIGPKWETQRSGLVVL